MGILSMLTTASVYVPAMGLAVGLMQSGVLDSTRFGSAGWTRSLLEVAVGPVLALIPKDLPPVLLLAAGYLALLVSFRLFDRSLPHVESTELRRGRWAGWIYQPLTMFAMGLLVTSLTLSVSVSLSILVPLAARGVIGRTTVIPYIMGANITTFIDTLFAALLLANPAAFTVVLAEMLSVATVSLVILLTMFGAYQRWLLALNSAIATTRVRFALFVGTIGVIPIILLLL
jgi:Na+/phosphate symporter